ncbi:thioredoxin family protein [Adhaeretor mobilis]|uniref:Thioredoxin n=1 Tax=Adhaeretor mobilis TaxID=1930276 RepID=A0A517MWL3_9BACT|nr:thioredoxin family protein [Adhaeretor mobilis]QDS99264.1 Thioredoxin [Adhaeretor mobilis]
MNTLIRTAPLMAAWCVFPLLGCSDKPSSVTSAASENDAPLSYLTANEFTQILRTSSQPVLVEFSVPAGCHRCEEMRPQLQTLATQLSGRAEVCSVNFNNERQVVTKLGIIVCPTYVAFENGKELFRMSHPTSGDLLLARLEESMNDQ